jgi:hypothetical protein
MGKHHAATSVPWSELHDAIQANPNRTASLKMGAASASLLTLPTEIPLAWLPGWTEDTSFAVSDPVALSLWISDPLYRVAAPVTRRSMEMEEAAALLHASESAWKEKNGRQRGWIRKHLEEDLRLRSGGGDPAPDAWASIKTTKRAALLLDYICMMRSIRVALWWPEQTAVTVVPLTGALSNDVIQLNCSSGRILTGPSCETKIAAEGWLTLLEKAKTVSEIEWIPPACAPSIGSHTVAQITERINAILGSSGTRTHSGGRIVLWNYLMWLLLKGSLQGKDIEAFPSVGPDPSGSSSPSETTT